MNEEIKEILDRLERIDHKEYSGGFEFADSGSFDEDGRCFEERKKLANYITNLQKENQSLKNNYNDNEQAIHKIMEENEKLRIQISAREEVCNKYEQRCEKAIEYIKQHCDRPGRLLLPKIDFNYNDLLNILQGGDE